MFVSCWSDIDVALSQVNVILSEVNSKLELCPAESRKNVLSRLSNILNEMMWTVSLSSEGSSDSDVSSSYSADVESMSWDNSEDLYRLYYDNDEDEDEDYENDDHGPIQFSDVEDQESSPHQSETNSNFVTKVFKTKASPEMIRCAPKVGPPVPVSSSDEEENAVKEDEKKDTGAAKFVNEMSVKIVNLAPDGRYKVVRPLKYRIDLTNVNVRFLQNIPKPQLYPVQGVSQDPKFYEKGGQNTDNNYYNRLWYRESGTMRHPHGAMYRYSTDVGIVPVPDDPVHGHVWKDHKWTLQAQVDDGVPASRGSWSLPRRRGRPSG